MTDKELLSKILELRYHLYSKGVKKSAWRGQLVKKILKEFPDTTSDQFVKIWEENEDLILKK